MRTKQPTSTPFLKTAFILMSGIMSLGLSSCMKDKCEGTMTYTVYDPVRISVNDLRNSFKVEDAKPMVHPGKIYLYDHYLLVNENRKGIHIIDNADPSAPRELAFLNIVGNVDMAVKDNVLYADNALDLLSIDISNPSHPVLLNRKQNVFTRTYYIYEDSVILDYTPRLVTQKYEDCRNNGRGEVFMTMDASSSNFSGGGSTSKPSIGGSMARFSISHNYLYTLDQSRLVSFDLTNAANPAMSKETFLSNNAETIFPYEDNLFIGTPVGMQIYSLNSPGSPTYVSNFGHVQSCDPVVVDGKYAYVTLRSGTTCRTNTTDELDVLDISNLSNPELVKSYSMENPRGLGIDNGTLFVCDGNDGLKVYDASDVNTLDQHLLATYGAKQFECNDVIPYNKNLIVTTSSGIYQYDYSNPRVMKLLSIIPVIQVIE